MLCSVTVMEIINVEQNFSSEKQILEESLTLAWQSLLQ